jgi:deferrochelatase/peroxidase EfeB
LQAGIYFRKDETPPKFSSLVLLKARPSATADDVRRVLEALWKLYGDLRQALVPDLQVPGEETFRAEVKDSVWDFDALLGFGPSAFDVSGFPHRPARLPAVGFAAPDQQGGPIVVANGSRANSGIPFARAVKSNRVNPGFAIQFTGPTPLTVERAAVETWKLLADRGPAAPLDFVTVYTGSQRDDRRSWIDFQDGTSNLSESERLDVIPIRQADDAETWTVGGTYLVFLRLALDLALWRNLTFVQQEGIVGRAKRNGCPLASVVPPPPAEAPGCPREPVSTPDPILRNSHVQRANHHFAKPADPASKRFYRQGYPFLESVADAPGFRAGLNFVSFQDTPWRVLALLTEQTWLGAINFGGPQPPILPPSASTARREMQAAPLVTAYAAGAFLVPPVSPDEAFPGAVALGLAREPAPA